MVNGTRVRFLATLLVGFDLVLAVIRIVEYSVTRSPDQALTLAFTGAISATVGVIVYAIHQQGGK